MKSTNEKLNIEYDSRSIGPTGDFNNSGKI